MRQGTVIATGFSVFFVLFYTFGGYPLEMILVNVFSLLINLIVLALVWSGHDYWILPHIIIFTIFNSLVGAAAFSGGISSSSIVWLMFMPVVATLLMGRRGGVFWGIVSMITAVVMYFLDDWFTAMALIPIRPLDRLIDLLTVLSVTIGAIWLSETARYRAWMQLELARAQLQRQANVDPLTQVYNRRYFADHTLDVLSTPQSVAFLSFDVDHFKSLNDRYGHEVGDQVLQIICQRVQHILRDGDVLARFGGEEFIVLLMDADEQTARIIAERIRSHVEREPFSTNAGELQVTISIGLALYSGVLENQQQMEALLRHADQAMYAAKRNGRNCVEVYAMG
jgi:diguanylate cyclase (GGDEF)-like protein